MDKQAEAIKLELRKLTQEKVALLESMKVLRTLDRQLREGIDGRKAELAKYTKQAEEARNNLLVLTDKIKALRVDAGALVSTMASCTEKIAMEKNEAAAVMSDAARAFDEAKIKMASIKAEMSKLEQKKSRGSQWGRSVAEGREGNREKA